MRYAIPATVLSFISMLAMHFLIVADSQEQLFAQHAKPDPFLLAAAIAADGHEDASPAQGIAVTDAD